MLDIEAVDSSDSDSIDVYTKSYASPYAPLTPPYPQASTAENELAKARAALAALQAQQHQEISPFQAHPQFQVNTVTQLDQARKELQMLQGQQTPQPSTATQLEAARNELAAVQQQRAVGPSSSPIPADTSTQLALAREELQRLQAIQAQIPSALPQPGVSSNTYNQLQDAQAELERLRAQGTLDMPLSPEDEAVLQEIARLRLELREVQEKEVSAPVADDRQRQELVRQLQAEKIALERDIAEKEEEYKRGQAENQRKMEQAINESRLPYQPGYIPPNPEPSPVPREMPSYCPPATPIYNSPQILNPTVPTPTPTIATPTRTAYTPSRVPSATTITVPAPADPSDRTNWSTGKKAVFGTGAALVAIAIPALFFFVAPGILIGLIGLIFMSVAMCMK